MKESHIAIQVLFEKYAELAGVIFTKEFAFKNADDDEKKSIEASEFMLKMMTGEFGKNKIDKDMKDLIEIVTAINYLSKLYEKEKNDIT